MSKPLRVLIVEDSLDDAELLKVELERGGYQTVCRRVDNPAAMQLALESERGWDIVLADYSMPQFSGIDALQLLKKNNLDLPFIIISGKIGEDTAVAAMQAGVHDYLVKGKLARLVPAVERELREAQLRQEHKNAQERLKYLAYYDDLTGLPNRSYFRDRLSEQIEQRETERQLFAVLLLHLDRFDRIKYSLGHSFSDLLLIAAARRLQQYLGKQGIVARVGTNELAILLTNLGDRTQAQSQAEFLCQLVAAPFQLQGTVAFTTASVGIAMSTIEALQPEQYLQAADTAMNYAKEKSTTNSAFFVPEMHAKALERLQLESDLRAALAVHQLHLNYQPIVCLKTGAIAGFEALARWQHDKRGSIAPHKFIPLLEETGSIVSFGQWILTQACQDLLTWHQRSTSLPLTISVNVSVIQLSQPDFILQIDRLLDSWELSGKHLKLEITESMLMENATAVTKVLKQLKARDIKLSIDDFGTGYSSLSYLHYLPIDTVKIDRSFIYQLKNSKNIDIVAAIINLAHSLELDVVAEGIETLAQLNLLQKLNCEYGQGYWFSPPLSSDEAIDKVDTIFSW